MHNILIVKDKTALIIYEFLTKHDNYCWYGKYFEKVFYCVIIFSNSSMLMALFI